MEDEEGEEGELAAQRAIARLTAPRHSAAMADVADLRLLDFVHLPQRHPTLVAQWHSSEQSMANTQMLDRTTRYYSAADTHVLAILRSYIQRLPGNIRTGMFSIEMVRM